MKTEYVIKIGELYVGRNFFGESITLGNQHEAKRWDTLDPKAVDYSGSQGIRKCVEFLTLSKVPFTLFMLTPNGVPTVLPELPPVVTVPVKV